MWLGDEYDFLIEIEGFEFLRGSNARLTYENLCAVGRKNVFTISSDTGGY